MTTDKERAAFEKAFPLPAGVKWEPDERDYSIDTNQPIGSATRMYDRWTAWKAAWKAARAASPVEPDAPVVEGRGIRTGYMDQIDADRDAFKFIDEAIQGLPVPVFAGEVETFNYENGCGRTTILWHDNRIHAATIVARDALNRSVLWCLRPPPHPPSAPPQEPEAVSSAVSRDSERLTNAVMDLVDSLGQAPKSVIDPRAWDHLRVYMPYLPPPGWRLMPLKPNEWALLSMMIELHSNVPEEQRPSGWASFSDAQRERIESAYRVLLANTPERRQLPTLAELEAMLATADTVQVKASPQVDDATAGRSSDEENPPSPQEPEAVSSQGEGK